MLQTYSIHVIDDDMYINILATSMEKDSKMVLSRNEDNEKAVVTYKQFL